MTQAIKDEELLVELLDDDMDATEYSININIDEGRMRIQFHNERRGFSSTRSRLTAMGL